LDVVSTALARVVRETALPEPRAIQRFDRARGILDRYVETVAGFALGIVCRELGVHDAPLRGLPPRSSDTQDGSVSVSARLKLHARFAMVDVEASRLVGHVDVIELAAAAQRSVLFERVAGEAEAGWRVLTAAVTGTPYPPLSSLWRAWVDKLVGRNAARRDATTQAGYIALVR
jgi:hypothetical protein